MACYAPSADGRYYPNYAQGNAPVASNVIVGNAYAAVSAAGALATGAGFGGLANAPVQASGLLNTTIAARGAANAPVSCSGVFTTHPGGNAFAIISPTTLASAQVASAYGPVQFVTANGVAPISFAAASGAAAFPSLRVSGTNLVDANGNVTFLRGASFQGLETSSVQGYAPWYGKTVPYAAYNALSTNCVRLPLCPASFLGLSCLKLNAAGTAWASTTPVAAELVPGSTKAAALAFIATMQAAGKHVIISPFHWSAPQLTLGGVTGYMLPISAPPHANSTVDVMMMDALIALFGTQATPQPGIDNTKIFFELNESYLDEYISPNTNAAGCYALMLNGGSLSTFKTNNATPDVPASWTVYGNQQIINRFRAANANNIWMFGGPGFSSSLSGAPSWMPVDPQGQVIAVLHPYCANTEAATPVWPYPAGAQYPGINYDSGSTGVNWLNSTLAAIAKGYCVAFTEDGGLHGYDASGTEPHITEVTSKAFANGVAGWLGWQYFQQRAGDPNNPAQGAYSMITSANVATENFGVVAAAFFASIANLLPVPAIPGVPPGMTLSTGGALAGTPTAPGNYSLTVIATDSSGGAGVSTPVALDLILDNEGPGGSVQGITNLDIPNSLVQANGTPYPNMPVLAAATVTAGDTAILIHTVATQAGNWPNVSGQDTQGGVYTVPVQIINKSNNQGAPSTNITQLIEMLVGALGGLKAGAYRGTVNLGTAAGGVGDTDYQALRLLTAKNVTAIVGTSFNNQLGSNGNGNVAPGTPITSDSAGVGIPVTQAQLPAFLLVVSFNQSGAGTNGILAPAIPPGSPLQLIDKQWQFNGSVAPVTVPQATFAYQQLTAPGNALATFATASNVDEAYMTIAAVFSGIYVPGAGATAAETLSLLVAGALLPGAPTNLTLVSSTATTATVSYVAPAGNGSPAVLSYRAVAVPVGGGTQIIATGTGLQITINGMVTGTTYDVYVQAENVNGFGAQSSTITVTPAGATQSPAQLYLNFLATALANKQILVFQHTQYYEGNTNDETQAYTSVTPLYAQTGQMPAGIGVTANFYGTYFGGNPYTQSGGAQPSLNVVKQIITDYCTNPANSFKPQAGAGVIQMNFGQSPPDGSLTVLPLGSNALVKATTPGDPYYAAIQGQTGILQTWLLSVVAANPNVVIKLRPLAELNSQYWYGAQNSQTDVNNQIKLHQQIVTTLFAGAGASLRNNVLIVYNGNGYGGMSPQAAWPGKAYADLAGIDVYDPNWAPGSGGDNNGSIQPGTLAAFAAFGVPWGFCECAVTLSGGGVVAPPQNSVSDLTIPAWMKKYAPTMVWYAQWNDNGQWPANGGSQTPHGSMSICLQNDASTLMNASYIIPLSKLPSFSGSGGATPPGQVQNLTLTGQTQNGQTFTWTPATPGSAAIASQNIYRTVTTNGVAGARTLLTNVSAGTTSYTDSTATNSQLNTSFNNGPTIIYSYDVTAVDVNALEGPGQPQMYAWFYQNGQACFVNGDYSSVTANYKDTSVSVPHGTYSISVPNPSPGSSYFQPFSGPPGTNSGNPGQPAITDQTFGTGCPIWAMETGAFNYLLVDILPKNNGDSFRINVISRLFGADVFNNAAFVVGGSGGAYGPATVAGVWGTYKIPLASIAGANLGSITASISGTALNVTAVNSGSTPQSGAWLIGSGVTAHTAISAPSPGGGPAPITLTVSNSQNVGSEAMMVQRSNSYKISFFCTGSASGYNVNNLGFSRA